MSLHFGLYVHKYLPDKIALWCDVKSGFGARLTESRNIGNVIWTCTEANVVVAAARIADYGSSGGECHPRIFLPCRQRVLGLLAIAAGGQTIEDKAILLRGLVEVFAFANMLYADSLMHS